MYKQDGNYILGAYLPNGKAFEAKNYSPSNLYKFINAILQSFILFEDTLEDVYKEMNPATTEDLIGRWETEFGMAKSCWGIGPDLETRRQNLLLRIGLDGIQTIDEFTELLTDMGFNVNIIAGGDYFVFPLAFPWGFMTELGAHFTVVVQLDAELNNVLFPFDQTLFPFPFSSGITNIIECLFKKLLPANVNAIFQYVL